MVACIIAMVVFGIVGLFSAKYRPFAKEAFNCTFRLMTLRPCNSDLDQKIKAEVTSRLITKTPRLAKAIHKYFNVISAIFVILFFVSLAYSGYATYNIIVHGTCDPQDPGQCFIPKPTGVCSPQCQESDCKHTPDAPCEECGCIGETCEEIATSAT